MSEPDGFLGRWSRRKREAATPEPTARATPAADAAIEAAPDPDAITPEELAALPPVESIDAQTDVSVFLRKGVPAFLRNAALSRAWAADPVIRDFVNDARDYALDWNTPGGAPGYGPLTDSDEVKEMVARIFGDPPAERDSVSHDETDGSDNSPDAATHNEPSANRELTSSTELKQIPEFHHPLRLSSETAQAIEEDVSSLPQQNTSDVRDSTIANKRHGGAVPV
jgi:hypothetical protein